MQMEFVLTLDDLVNFNLIHTQHSPTVKRTVTIQRFAFPVFFLSIPLFFAYIRPDIWAFFLPASVLMALIWVFFYPRSMRRHMKKYVEKMLKEGPNRGLVGRHTLILSPEGIRDLSEVGETSSLWASVEKVIRDPNYLLIYNSAVSAYVIPAKAFSSATDLQAFADYADAHRRIL